MLICEGDTHEYGILQKASCETYLLKLENYVDKVETAQKQLDAIRNKNNH